MGPVVGLLFLGIGLLMLVFGLVQFRTAKASQDWPSVEGEIVHATVGVKVSRDEDGTSRSYAPQVLYTYSVRGQQYTSDRVTVGARRRYSSHRKAEAKLQYQNGEKVTVYYNPKKPAQAVLKCGAVGGALPTLLIGIAFAIGGGIVLVRAI